MLSTPILFLVFNRPEVTEQVFKAIRKCKPHKLYIAADGPRSDRYGEVELCQQTRQISEQIDWDCEVHTLFREENLGCKGAVSKAINWFFENEEEGIIFEDDCLPDQSFFTFCQEMLEKYRNDQRVMMVSGFNALDNYEHPYSYTFSKLGAIWGWASWRRAWNFYDVNMKLWNTIKSQQILDQIFPTIEQRKYRELVCEKTYNEEINTWDYQWSFTRLIHNGLSIMPTTNLITNIGFGKDATHTTNVDEQDKYPTMNQISFPLQHPPFMYINHEFDNLIFDKTIGYKIPDYSISNKIKNKVSNIKNRIL